MQLFLNLYDVLDFWFTSIASLINLHYHVLDIECCTLACIHKLILTSRYEELSIKCTDNWWALVLKQHVSQTVHGLL